MRPGRAIHLLLACTLLMAACGDSEPTGTPGALGRLAFSEAGSGKLVILDLATSVRTELTPGLGAPGAIALEPDGEHVAFSVEPSLGERHVFVGDATTRELHEVVPQTGSFMAGFAWGHGGWFTYASWTTGPQETRLATTTSSETRVIGTEAWPVYPLPVEAAFLYRQCTAPAPPGENCPDELR